MTRRKWKKPARLGWRFETRTKPHDCTCDLGWTGIHGPRCACVLAALAASSKRPEVQR